MLLFFVLRKICIKYCEITLHYWLAILQYIVSFNILESQTSGSSMLGRMMHEEENVSFTIHVVPVILMLL